MAERRQNALIEAVLRLERLADSRTMIELLSLA
jgi:hypothetical protein